MRQFVHQGYLRLAGQHRIDVHLGQLHPLVLDPQLRNHLEPFQQKIRLGSAVGFHVSRHHVAPFALSHLRGLEHGVRLPHARRVPQEDLQLAAPALSLFLGLGHLEQRFR
ncbi:MAG: hypothetical protein ACD_55C00110G0003 [uncultured bacterium]|nr:MAG: hypothetical protein ACD_55C00110G0003 [uncultured bacterium]